MLRHFITFATTDGINVQIRVYTSSLFVRDCRRNMNLLINHAYHMLFCIN